MKILLGVLVCAQALAQPVVTKVEPPNWWTRHTINPVRVLIRGTKLKSASVAAGDGLRASRVSVNERGTYLFVDIKVAGGAKPGARTLRIRTPEGEASAAFRIDEPLPEEGRFQGFSPDDVIYLIMPDRFANGDLSNDDPEISKGLFDPTKPRHYHGGDFQGIIDRLPYLKDLGVTALWLTPVYDNHNALNRKEVYDGQPITDYHGYGAVDYYGVEEHFGNLALLRKLVDLAHQSGMKVIQDQVANHVGPYHPWVNNPPMPAWFHGTEATHPNETWQVWSLADPYGAALRRNVLDGWFINLLPDMNQENPEVATYEIQNALWWLGATGFDGIRQDTLPYVPKAFWHDWSAALHKQYPKARAVGEVFDSDAALTSFFQGGESGIDSVFDFPGYFKIRETFAQQKPITELARTLGRDRLYANPEMLVTFLGLHDVKRFINETGSTPAGMKLAFTFLLTARGTPMIYYGDEIAMPGGNDPDNRRDYPWTTRTPEQEDMFGYVRKLLHLRAELPSLRRARMETLAINDQAWVYRRGDAVIAVNNGNSAADLVFPYEGRLRGRLAHGAEVASRNGVLEITVPARSAEIYVRN